MPRFADYLIDVRRRIVWARGQIARQQIILARLQRTGTDTRQAETLLLSMEVLLNAMLQHRARIEEAVVTLDRARRDADSPAAALEHRAATTMP